MKTINEAMKKLKHQNSKKLTEAMSKDGLHVYTKQDIKEELIDEYNDGGNIDYWEDIPTEEDFSNYLDEELTNIDRIESEEPITAVSQPLGPDYVGFEGGKVYTYLTDGRKFVTDEEGLSLMYAVQLSLATEITDEPKNEEISEEKLVENKSQYEFIDTKEAAEKYKDAEVIRVKDVCKGGYSDILKEAKQNNVKVISCVKNTKEAYDTIIEGKPNDIAMFMCGENNFVDYVTGFGGTNVKLIKGATEVNEVKEVTIPTKDGQEFVEYNFDEEDVEFIKGLLGDTVDVVLGSNDGNNKIDLKLAETKYIDSGIINFKSELYDEIEKYVKGKQPNAKLEVNNTGSTIWLRQEDFTKAIRPTTKIR